jgi:hypothetical protein
LVGVSAERELMLWSISECLVLKSRSSSRMARPEYACQRHMLDYLDLPPGAAGESLAILGDDMRS